MQVLQRFGSLELESRGHSRRQLHQTAPVICRSAPSWCSWPGAHQAPLSPAVPGAAQRLSTRAPSSPCCCLRLAHVWDPRCWTSCGSVSRVYCCELASNAAAWHVQVDGRCTPPKPHWHAQPPHNKKRAVTRISKAVLQATKPRASSWRVRRCRNAVGDSIPHSAAARWKHM